MRHFHAHFPSLLFSFSWKPQKKCICSALDIIRLHFFLFIYIKIDNAHDTNDLLIFFYIEYIYNQDGGHKRRLLFFFHPLLDAHKKCLIRIRHRKEAVPFFLRGRSCLLDIFSRIHLSSSSSSGRDDEKGAPFISLREISSKWVLFITHVERYSCNCTTQKVVYIYTSPYSILLPSNSQSDYRLRCASSVAARQRI